MPEWLSKLGKRNLILLGIGIVTVAAFVFAFISSHTTVYTVDTVLSGDHVVPSLEKVVLKNGAKLTVNGNYTVEGKLKCEDGSLNLHVNGDFTLNNRMECELNEGVDGVAGIALVVSGGIEFSEDAEVVSNGHVQIVDDAEHLATTQEEIDEIFDETGENSGDGPRFGPFHSNEDVVYDVSPVASFGADELVVMGNVFVQPAHAQAVGPPIIIRGKMIIGRGQRPPGVIFVPQPPPNVKKIILYFNFGPNRTANLRNLTIFGPDAHDGAPDEGSCTVAGEDGKNAMRFRGRAQTIVLDNFSIFLGDGGAGGRAETSNDCDPGVATGGAGGESGNFKLSATESIQIKSFNIFPGTDGDGGEAVAHGKTGEVGCPGKKGGDATATGGAGSDALKKLSARGNVRGIDNISVASVDAGDGGDATANPGNGGNGTTCGCAGGPGGAGTATGGDGGDTNFTVPPGITHDVSSDTPGDGGDATVNPATGGTGGSCPVNVGPGGNGGKGTNSSATHGLAGTGGGGGGIDGNKSEPGGTGGNGGDGCNEGAGGDGGSGDPDGDPGDPGKRICLVTPPPGISIGDDEEIIIDDGGIIILEGGEATLVNFELLGEFTGQTVSLGGSSRVFGWGFGVRDSDIRIERAKIRVQNTGSGDNRPWRYFDSVGLYVGDTIVKRLDADSPGDWSEVTDNVYEKSFSGLNSVVKDGGTGEVSIEIVALSLVDSSNVGAMWQISLPPNGMRVKDAAGENVFGPSSGIDSFFDIFFDVQIKEGPSTTGQFFFEVLPPNLQIGVAPHIIFASDGDPDVRELLPLNLYIDVDGSEVWQGTIEGDPNVVCRGADGCSMDGPIIQPGWSGMNLEIFADGFESGDVSAWSRAIP